MGKQAWNLGLTAKIRESKECVALMRNKADEILKERSKVIMNSPKKDKITDIIQAITYEKMDKSSDFSSYSDKDLVDDFIAFLLGGTDTTTLFFTMMVYYIGKHPEVHKKLREQINSFIKTDADLVYDNLKQLVYIDWIQHETTRMFGPANINFWRTA